MTTPTPDDWNRTTAALRRIARAIVRDESLSEDLVQGAYLSALERGSSEPRPGWLRAVVRSRAIDSVRRRATGRSAALGASEGRSGAAESTDEIVGRLELQQAILQAVRDLDDPYRETIYLRYFEDLGPTRIAKRLGVPVKTVKTRLTRGLARLAERFRQEHGDDERGGSSLLHAFAFGQLPRVTAPPPSSLTPPAPIDSILAGLAMKKTALVTAAVVTVVATLIFTVVRSTSGDDAHKPARAQGPGQPAAVLKEPSDLEAPPIEDGLARIATELPSQPEPSAVPEPDTGSLRLHVVWSDGTDAENVAIVLRCEGARRSASRKHRSITDARGMAEFDLVRPGTVQLSADRGAQRETFYTELDLEPVIVAGSVTSEELTLSKGVRVQGRVVDDSGAPVGGAGIWLTAGSPGWTAGRIVCHSDAGGNFQLWDVPGGQSLGALAAGFAPSSLADLDLLDPSVQPVEVVLTVSAPGGSLFGRVTDAAGDPLEDAVVVTGESRGFLDVRPNDTIAEQWTPLGTRTDADGNFRLVGLLPGAHVVRVRRLGLPTWLGSATVEADGQTQLDVVLLAGATLSGTVCDVAGEPVAGATVHVFDKPISEGFLQGGQIDYAGSFAHEATTTNEDGRYELPLVPPGQVWAYAMAPLPERHRLGNVMLYTKIELAPTPGEELEWNAVLSEGPTISGVARYLDGTPIKRVFIHARPTGGGMSRSMNTRDGVFKFIQLSEALYDVSVQIWEPPEGSASVQALAVAPGGDPLELVADFNAPVEHEPSTVTVRFADEGERAANPEAVGVILEAQRNFSWYTGERDGDVWTFEVRKPDTYTPVAMLGERVIAIGEPFQTIPGEAHDVGTLSTIAGSELLLRIDRSALAPDASVAATIYLESSNRAESVELGSAGEQRIENLQPGPGTISVSGESIVTDTFPFVTTAGEETVLELSLRPAVPVPYRVYWNSAHAPGKMSVLILDRSDGSVAHRVDLPDASRYNNPIKWTYRAPVGTFTLVVELGNGKSGSQDFDVTSFDPESVPAVEVDLR